MANYETFFVFQNERNLGSKTENDDFLYTSTLFKFEKFSVVVVPPAHDAPSMLLLFFMVNLGLRKANGVACGKRQSIHTAPKDDINIFTTNSKIG